MQSLIFLFADHASLKNKIVLTSTQRLSLQVVVEFFARLINENISLFVIWESCYGYLLIDELMQLIEN